MVDDDRLSRLGPAQRRLYEQRLRAREQATPRCVGPGPHALSFAQERFWFLDQLEPASSEYVVSGAARFRGRIDVAALERALTRLVERQASLRTTLPARDGVPGQLVHLPAPFALQLEDSRAVPDAEADLARRLRELANTPFDLARGPLFRAHLIQLGDDHHVFAFELHHATCDGWSLAVLVRELAVLYRAERTGVAADLPPLPLQYADHAAAQRERMSGAVLDRLLVHWRATLDGAPASLELPFDRPRRTLPERTGATLRFALDAALAAPLRALATAEHVTPFVLVLAAFQAFLSRLCDEEDVVVGTTVANRDRRETESLIGAFVNTLVLRTSCAGEPTFRELVARAHATVRAALAHAELPFEKLVAELAPARDPSRTPLFNVFFDMAVPRPRPAWDDLAQELLVVERGRALFDLGLSIEEHADGLHGAFEYSTELFDAATIERLRSSFKHFLAAAVAAPDERIARIPLLDAAERERIVATFNATALPYDRGESVPELFARRVAVAPDAIALEDGRARVTYRELDARANRLAHALVRCGAGVETRVAVCLPRSTDAIVALLATWKAGAAYVPLDVDDPPLRQLERLVDVGAVALVTHAAVAARLPRDSAWTGARIALDEDAALGDVPATDPRIARAPEALAYVLFTSGSTGKPKGVMIEHAALANHLAWVRQAFDLRPDDRFLLRTPFTFDASLWEIVHPLAQGATLVVAPPDSGHDPALLLEQCARERITVAQTVPSLLRVWLEEPWFARCRALRHLICAGEALDPDLAARFFATTRELGLTIALHNLYGPSEATIDATWHTLGPRDVERGLDAVPIGRPISNASAYVLDARDEPVPIGVVGELSLGGDGLGRGYWNDAELTARRFVPNPFGAGRVYRTGDRARWNADGTLSYVGRSDRQVKIAGVRIEPGEIEGELRAHPDVQDAAVVAAQLGSGRTLRAFVTAAEGRAPDPAALRAHLAARLPRTLVPASIVVLDALPLSASLKVDLRALADLAQRTDAAPAFEPPRTPTEVAIAAIASELLATARVGRGDDFFALGGHSLLAARLVARAREQWRVAVPLARFFDDPTVAGLARLVDGARGVAAAVPVKQAPEAPRELSFAQAGLWIVHQLDPQSVLYVVSGGLRLRGALDADLLQRALDRVVLRHEILRSTFESDNGAPRVRVHANTVAMQRLDVSSDPRGADAALRAHLEVETRHEFDLGRGPLLRAALLRLGERDHVFALTVHHILADGWSLELLVGELARVYAAELEGREPDLAPLALQYSDWAAWERAQAHEPAFAAHVAWWRTALAGAPPRVALPVDRAEPDVASNAGAIVAFEVERALADAARAYAREHRVPLYPVLAAAFAALLVRAGADEDLVLGTVTGIRPHAVLEALIGPFVNVLPLRVDASGEPTFDELVRRVARTSAAAWEHGGVPFERIVAELGVPRASGREPFGDVACDLQSFPENRVRFPGLEAELVHVDPGTTKLDLSLTFEDDGRRLGAAFQYATALFARATVEALARSYVGLLAAALAQPARALAHLEPIGAAPASAALTLASRAELAAHGVDASRAASAVVLDARGSHQPVGFVGELALIDTETRRTGLLARITAEGRVVVLGRVGEALVVAGRRVRPSAVERALALDPDVRAAVVEGRVAADGTTQLVAHVVANDDVDLATVAARARARLAAAAIPELWRVMLRAAAHSTTGAVDRAQLARVALDQFAPATPTADVAPRDELEAQVHDLFAAELGRERVSVLDDFFALGGASLAAMRLVARIRAATGVDLPLSDLYAGATIAAVARALVAIRAGRPRAQALLDLRADAHLGPDFPAHVVARWSGPPRRWLLTGATGYLGAFLVRALLDRGAEEVHCLVRARDDAQGRERIAHALRRYSLSTDGLEQRVRIVRGDLEQADLGLDEARRAQLAEDVDAIVHSGAAVHFLADYRRLHATNVRATETLLALAARRGLPFHHVSTLGVFGPPVDRAHVQREDEPLPGPEGLEWGYEQSKWVAEHLVAEARTRGLDVTIHRPGRIAGSARDGVWNLDDFAARLLRGIVAIGAAPDIDAPVDMTPVDWVADAIVHLAASRPRGAAYHLANPTPTSFLTLFERLRARGADLRIVTLAEWLAEARTAVAGRADHELAPLLEMIGAGRDDVDPARLVPDVDMPQLDLSNTLRDVVGAGIACPVIDDALRDRWIDHFVRAGAIELGARVARAPRDAAACSGD